MISVQRRSSARELAGHRVRRGSDGSEQAMWIRAGVGLVLCLIGAVWIAQGSGAMHGSMMTGHGQYTALGVLAALGGIVLIAWSVRRRGGKPL